MGFRQLGSSVAIAALVVVAVVHGDSQVTFINRCGRDIPLYDNVAEETLSTASPLTRTLVPKASGGYMFRKGINPQATLAEITIDASHRVWYDISIIPTGNGKGPEWCTSLQDCKESTGGTGFNVGMQIKPDQTNNDRCVTLTCEQDGCVDAYHHPKDDKNTHTCPPGTNFEIVFCPSGKAQNNPPAAAAAAVADAPPPPPTTAPPTAPPTTQAPPTTTPTPPTTPPPATTTTTTNSPTTSPTVSVDTINSLQKLLESLPKNNNATTNAPSTVEESDLSNPISTVAATVAAAPDGVADVIEQALPTATTPRVVTANTKSKGSDSSKVGIILLTGFVVAAALTVMAVLMVRQKRQQLQALDLKTPTCEGGVML